MEKPWARRATALPIRPPPPMRPMVLPQTYEPIRCADWPPGNLAARTIRSPSIMRRATASIRPKVRSAVASVVSGAVTVTGMRRAVAVATSMLDGAIDLVVQQAEQNIGLAHGFDQGALGDDAARIRKHFYARDCA